MVALKAGGAPASAQLGGWGKAGCLQKGRAGSRLWIFLSISPPKKRLLEVEGLHSLLSRRGEPAELLASQARVSLLLRELQPPSDPSSSRASALNHQVVRQRNGNDFFNKKPCF